MHAVIRTYSGSGATELFDLLEKREADVETLMRQVEGFVSYHLVETPNGGTSVTICRDKAGTDESIRKARDWIEANASDLQAHEPMIEEGPVIAHVSAQDAAAQPAAAVPLSA